MLHLRQLNRRSVHTKFPGEASLNAYIQHRPASEASSSPSTSEVPQAVTRDLGKWALPPEIAPTGSSSSGWFARDPSVQRSQNSQRYPRNHSLDLHSSDKRTSRSQVFLRGQDLGQIQKDRWATPNDKNVKGTSCAVIKQAR